MEIRFGQVHELAAEVLRSPIFDILHARPVVPTLASAARIRQDMLVQRHELFGGRDDELARLDRQVAGKSTSFHFVYGPSGYGKTALLANWVRQLQARHQPVVFQFISRLEGMAGEEFALRNLCEQLVAVHGLPGALPASVDELRNVHRLLLERPTPGDQPLAVVIDGLDEANAWEPRGLFPATAGPRLHMVFSARVDNDEDRDRWLSRLGVPRRSTDWVHLGPMDAVAIAGLLRHAGDRAAELASDEAFVQALAARSGGDPFYLYFLVKDVESGHVGPGNLFRQPAELADYLQQWLDQLHQDVDIRVAEVYALVGLLSVAMGPLRPADLAGASPLLSKGALLDRELSGSLRRYLAGNRRTGFALCHPRFRDFLCQRVFTKEELTQWRDQLLDHCRRWRTADASDYVLDHLVGHLIEVGATDELFELIGLEWKAARMRRTGSARAFAQDLALAFNAATASRPPALLQAIRCSLLHGSVVSTAQNIQPEVLALMARLASTDPKEGGDASFGAAAALDHAMLIRDPLRRAEAQRLVGVALRAVGDQPAARMAFASALESVESTPDLAARVSAHLALGDALCKAEGSPADSARLVFSREGEHLLDRIITLVEESIHVLADPVVLAAAAAFFDRVGRADIAAPMRERSEQARQSNTGFNIDFSGIDFSKLFLGTTRAPELLNVQTLCGNADRSLDTGRRAEALESLNQARALLSGAGEQAGHGADTARAWCLVAEGFARAGDTPNAAVCAQSARDFVRQVGEPGHVWLDTSKTQLLIGAARALALANELDDAQEAARDAVANCRPEEAQAVAAEFIALAQQFESLGARRTARVIVRRVVSDTAVVRVGTNDAQAVASLALAAAQRGMARPALCVLDDFKRHIDAAGDSWPCAQLLGVAARVQATASPRSKLAAESARALRLTGTNQALAHVLLARAHAVRQAVQPAVDAVTAAVALLGPFDGFMIGVHTSVVLEAARAMSACGHAAWARVNAAVLLPLTEGSGSNHDQAVLLGDIATALAEAGDHAAAHEHAGKALRSALRYGSGIAPNTLVPAVRWLVELGERRRASALVADAARVVATLEGDGYGYGNCAPAVVRAAVAVGDESTIDHLEVVIAALDGSESSNVCRARLAAALAEGGRGEAALRHAATALDGIAARCESGWRLPDGDACAQLAMALAQAGNRSGLERLLELQLEQTPRSGWSNLKDLMLALALAGNVPGIRRIVAAVDHAAAQVQRVRAFERSVLWAAASTALYAIGHIDEARAAATTALQAFEEERDGSVTPKVLPVLVPPLLQAADRDGLLRLLYMPADRWPYPNEWGPGLRHLLPALAELGVDNPRPEALERLAGMATAHAEAQCDIARALARRGEVERAAATAAAIGAPLYRARAHLRIAQLLAQRGDLDAALRMLDHAAAGLPAVRADLDLMGELAAFAARIGARTRLRDELTAAFLRSARLEMLTLDAEIFSHALPGLAAGGDTTALERALALVEATGPAEPRARCAAALALACARAGRTNLRDRSARCARQAVAAIVDPAERAVPLRDLAITSLVAGRRDEALGTFLQALGAARLGGRYAVLDVAQEASDVACEFGVAPQALAAIVYEGTMPVAANSSR